MITGNRAAGNRAAGNRAVVLITGCSSGVGLRAAVAAAARGHDVVATVREPARADDLRKAAADAGVTLDVRRLDVTDEDSAREAIASTVDAHGRLDVVVNNAGIAHPLTTAEVAGVARYREIAEIGYLGAVAVTSAAMPHLRASGGRVLAVGATRGLVGEPFAEAYAGAKFALEGFLESLAPVAGAMGVGVTVVVPGPISQTAFAVNAGISAETLFDHAGPYREVLERYVAHVRATGYPGAQTATEVAEVIAEVIDDPAPPFRVYTGAWARDFAAAKLADLDGTAVAALSGAWLGGSSP
ncbi:short-chain dehydrogenase/reductase [Actinorhabdospora filicis]|uniref:Short-chain dehydrogenase/reductase n=1 Tax=Actinorhabdospora filicis TaxID=1785913 RepID=A0A9W6WDD0_9ACTN|nr:SDR family NAD(P)-dependent oxidoreductase [Actinorhabdospora filicis]GLZ81486.1 short-chain dehydrogenase/reductase [Actinorhabdospora filicis]